MAYFYPIRVLHTRGCRNGESRSLRVVRSLASGVVPLVFGALLRLSSLSLSLSLSVSPLYLVDDLAPSSRHFSSARLGTFRFYPRRAHRVGRAATRGAIYLLSDSLRQMSLRAPRASLLPLPLPPPPCYRFSIRSMAVILVQSCGEWKTSAES